MRLKSIHVKNFRSIRDGAVELATHTAFLGANGTGKSTFLRAIDRFYGTSSTVELDDFFGRKPENPIEISLTFVGFTDSERELFASRIHGGEMSVVRVFEAAGGKTNGRYFGLTKQHPAFVEVRQTAGARPKTQAYDRLRELPNFTDKLAAVRRADDIDPILVQYEAQHPDECEVARDDGQFFGFSNVARGNLKKATAFVFIPAVRDASADALDARGAVVAQLMELVVRSAVQRRTEIIAFQNSVSTRYHELTDPAQLHELGDLADELTTTLKFFYGAAAVLLAWKPAEDLTLPLPSADVSLDDDGFTGPIDRKGHGLQRAFILTLLQHLAKAVAAGLVREEQEQAIASQTAVGAQVGTDAVPAAVASATQAMPAPVLPGLILAIEEPELYQHPTKQRHFAKVLRQVSDGILPGVARQTQVIFASHSSLFVSMEHFDQVRLARRYAVPDADHKECKCSHTTLKKITERLETAWQRPAGTFTEAGLRVRLHIINAEIAEGFFADKVVLVEGTSDRAAIYAAARLNNMDLEANGIAVLSADGKTKLDRPAAIFLELGIPTFLVWDCDRKPDKIDKLETNRALQRLMGGADIPVVDAGTVVAANYACFDRDLDATVKVEIGADIYDRELDTAKTKYDLETRDDAQKTPAAMADVLAGAAAAGRRSATLDRVIAAILALP